MTKKTTTITILTILTLTIIVGGFWYVKNQQKENVAIKEKSQEMDSEKEKENQKEEENDGQKIEELNFEEIDINNWQTYRNEELGFEIKYPDDWSMIFQNKFDKHNNANILFYYAEKLEDDIKKSSNPFLSVIKLNIPSISLDISGNDFAKKDFLDEKKYIISKYECLDVFMSTDTTKLIEWKQFTTKDNRFIFYYYKILVCSNLLREGIIVKNRDILFIIENHNNCSNFNSIIKTFRFF